MSSLHFQNRHNSRQYKGTKACLSWMRYTWNFKRLLIRKRCQRRMSTKEVTTRAPAYHVWKRREAKSRRKSHLPKTLNKKLPHATFAKDAKLGVGVEIEHEMTLNLQRTHIQHTKPHKTTAWISNIPKREGTELVAHGLSPSKTLK